VLNVTSQVYRELATMAEAGMVDAQPAGPRDRHPYRLTDAGREAFTAWIDREPVPENIRFPLLLTIEFGRHLEPERLAAFVHAHRADHARRLARYEAMQRAADGAPADRGDPYALATLHFGIAYERAALAWFDQLPAAIRGPGAWARPE
jgi:DNA-binding PadR family transcriptional regulator